MKVLCLLFNFGYVFYIAINFSRVPAVNASSSVETVTANASGTAFLICPKSSNISITFWTGPPGFMTYSFPGSTDIDEQLPNADRLEINASNAALLIHNITLADEGLYRCSATGFGEADIRLEVTNVPPTHTGIDKAVKDGNREVIRGYEDRRLTMICSADGGKPVPAITWSRPDTSENFPTNYSLVEHNNGTFDVSRALNFFANRSLDGVVFTCSIYHPALESALEYNAEIFLNLKPVLEKIGDTQVTTEGFNTTVSCKVSDARPESNISLYFNGVQMTGFNDAITIYDDSSNTFSTATSFTRVMNRVDNEIAVLCNVHHMALDTPINRTWNIVVQYPPSVSVSSENTTSASGNVALECLAHNGNPELYTFLLWQHTWPAYRGILREIPSTSTEKNRDTLTLSNPTFKDSGFYKCRARNGVGILSDPKFIAENDVYIIVKDVPYVVDGRPEYHSNIDEKIDIILDVYSNVEPIDVSIKSYLHSGSTSAIWTIVDINPEIVGVPVYSQKIVTSGFRITITFEVQAEKNYGWYGVAVRNNIGVTYHNFSVLPIEKEPTGKETNIAGIVAGTVVPAVVIAIGIVVGCFMYRRFRREQSSPGEAISGEEFSNDAVDVYSAPPQHVFKATHEKWMTKDGEMHELKTVEGYGGCSPSDFSRSQKRFYRLDSLEDNV